MPTCLGLLTTTSHQINDKVENSGGYWISKAFLEIEMKSAQQQQQGDERGEKATSRIVKSRSCYASGSNS